MTDRARRPSHRKIATASGKDGNDRYGLTPKVGEHGRRGAVVPVGLLLTLLCVAVSSANATPVTFSFTGTVTGVSANVAGTFNTTQTLSGSYTFESTSADLNATPSLGVYAVLVANSLSLSIGGYSAGQVGPSNASDVVVVELPPLISFDFYSGQWNGNVSGAPVGSLTPRSFSFNLIDSTATVFATEALPGGPPSLAAFNSGTWFLGFASSTNLFAGGVQGTITSLEVVPTPEPITMLLGGTGLSTLAYAARKRLFR